MGWSVTEVMKYLQGSRQLWPRGMASENMRERERDKAPEKMCLGTSQDQKKTMAKKRKRLLNLPGLRLRKSG